MNELKRTMNLNQFYAYCCGILNENGEAHTDIYQAQDNQSGQIMVDIIYRIVREPEQLEFDFGE